MKTNLNFKIIVLIIISTLLLNSCATIFGNTTEQILIYTDAKDVSIIVNNMYITNTIEINDQDINQYPLFKLDKSKNSKYLLILQTKDLITLKKEGYKDRRLKIEKSIKYGYVLLDLGVGSYYVAMGWLSGMNGYGFIFGFLGLLPLIVDIATSNLTYYSDNIIYVNMELEPQK